MLVLLRKIMAIGLYFSTNNYTYYDYVGISEKCFVNIHNVPLPNGISIYFGDGRDIEV